MMYCNYDVCFSTCLTLKVLSYAVTLTTIMQKCILTFYQNRFDLFCEVADKRILIRVYDRFGNNLLFILIILFFINMWSVIGMSKPI